MSIDYRNRWLIAITGILLLACSRDPQTRDGEPVGVDEGCDVHDCSPGEVRECDAGGLPAVEVCDNDCTWGPCEAMDVTVDTALDTDSATDTEVIFIPPAEACPDGTYELNIRDIWSATATPRLNNNGGAADGPLPFATPANTIRITNSNEGAEIYGAKLHTDNCDFYRTCLPSSWTSIYLQPNNPADECVDGMLRSCLIDIPDVAGKTKVTMTYEGTNEELTSDYFNGQYVGWANGFTIIDGAPEVLGDTDPLVYKEECTNYDDYIVLHIRWPWSEPDVSGFAGTGCEDDLTGSSTPPYPATLRVNRGTVCAETVAILERNDGFCPWYRLLVPRSEWDGNTIQFEHPDRSAELRTNPIDLPSTADFDTNELWLVYEGAEDDENNQGTPCMNFSYRNGVYHFYTANLGPGYPGCGGPAAPVDCTEVKPVGYSIVHFRYLWAGQKTFTYFPDDAFMPASMILHVNGSEYFCVQEGKSPWFRCPIPNEEFYEGAMWRAVDKNHEVEWNTVEQLPTFPANPGTYWIRWYYGKPDIPATVQYDITTYYPDGVEWAETGAWGDDFCFTEDQPDRPMIESDGFFPWDETRYEYGNGQSIAKWYDNPAAVQNLMNYFVWERYLIWKELYLKEGDEACGEGTARVDSSDSVSPTVSEGQGYGMAISAAIGDKDTFDKLWRFVNHFLSQGDKYCGGLMGWAWKGPDDCQPYGSNATSGGDRDSAFDGDVDIAIGLVYAAWQWPEYTQDAVDWLLKMECEVNTAYDGLWYYPTPGDTFEPKNCMDYPNAPCAYSPGVSGRVNMSYYPPGYFRVFGEFLAAHLPASEYTVAERLNHLDFWYHTAETTWEMVERCYDDAIHPALLNDWGSYDAPCSAESDNYNWSRGLWRLAIDAAWYGHDDTFFSATPGSSRHYDDKSEMQAKMDLIQNFYSVEFPAANPPVDFANRFSRICRDISPGGVPTDCDPAYDHNSYFVTTGMSSFVTFFDNDGQTTPEMRREALEEAVSVAIQDDRYYQETLGVYQLLFLTGNFPRPYARMDTTVVIE